MSRETLPAWLLALIATLGALLFVIVLAVVGYSADTRAMVREGVTRCATVPQAPPQA